MGAVSSLIWEVDRSGWELQRPVVVLAFAGWFDAATVATAALENLALVTGAKTVARISCEEYLDLRIHRPRVFLADDHTRQIEWPDTLVRWAPAAEGARDIFLIGGPEPDYRWRHFVDDVLSVADAVGAELVLTLGAMAGRVPHTRPATVSASATTVELTHALGLSLPRYAGVTGVVGVLQQAMGATGRDGISLRVDVPFYLGGAGFPPGTAALLERVEQLLGVSTGQGGRRERIAEWHSAVAEGMAENPEVRRQIGWLESAYDRAQAPDAGNLFADLERYLGARREEG